jgi:hypothetical protein
MGMGKTEATLFWTTLQFDFFAKFEPQMFFLACKIMRDAARKTECKV